MAALQAGSKCSHTIVYAHMNDFCAALCLALEPDPEF